MSFTSFAHVAVPAVARSGMDSASMAIAPASISGSGNDSDGKHILSYFAIAGTQARATACHRKRVHDAVYVAVGHLLGGANSLASM